jgi:hypothetical protein
MKLRANNTMKKKNNEPKPKWTVTTKESEKVFTHYLRYDGKKVHSLTGENGFKILSKTAGECNASGYTPTFSSTKLLHELSASKRKELDDLYAKSVPDLFVESEVEA